MNPYLPPPGAPRPFACTPGLLKRIAVGLGAYALLVLYPAYLAFAWINTGAVPGFWQIAIVTACAALFSLHAYRDMSNLTRPKRG